MSSGHVIYYLTPHDNFATLTIERAYYMDAPSVKLLIHITPGQKKLLEGQKEKGYTYSGFIRSLLDKAFNAR